MQHSDLDPEERLPATRPTTTTTAQSARSTPEARIDESCWFLSRLTCVSGKLAFSKPAAAE
ncbi:MAG: hypothetical protein ACI841_000315 [Planctomycetota bacterium]|jgi:hypothetical protein